MSDQENVHYEKQLHFSMKNVYVLSQTRIKIFNSQIIIFNRFFTPQCLENTTY